MSLPLGLSALFQSTTNVKEDDPQDHHTHFQCHRATTAKADDQGQGNFGEA